MEVQRNKGRSNMKTTYTTPDGLTKTRKGDYSHVVIVKDDNPKTDNAGKWYIRNWCGTLAAAEHQVTRFNYWANAHPSNAQGEIRIIEIN
jgi:hypothetical protein